MTEKEKARRAFMFEIIRNTQDKVSWLVFAEWLEEQNEVQEADRMRRVGNTEEDWVRTCSVCNFILRVTSPMPKKQRINYE